MLAALGDVVDDIVVRVSGAAPAAAVHVGADTEATIIRRRGGSAANVASIAGRLSGAARFLGQVGDDAIADVLLGELAADGVDVSRVRRRGRTGAIVVLVDATGERSFLSDPGSARQLDRPDPAWLGGVDVLHVPLYSLVDEPMASTATTLIGWAHERGIAVSVDASSVTVLEAFGVPRALALLADLRPQAVFANGDEARLLGIDAPLGAAVTFVKNGPEPAVVYAPGTAPAVVAATPVDHVSDTTGAGDAFAAGVLTSADWPADPTVACAAGHRAAADLLRSRA